MPRRSASASAFPASATRLKPPDDLDGPELQLFIDLVLACRPNHFAASDAPLLAVYCRHLVLEKIASAGLKADGYVTPEGKPSSWLNALAQATRVISTYSRMLKLNPAGREASKSSEVKKPGMPVGGYERITMEARSDEPN